MKFMVIPISLSSLSGKMNSNILSKQLLYSYLRVLPTKKFGSSSYWWDFLHIKTFDLINPWVSIVEPTHNEI